MAVTAASASARSARRSGRSGAGRTRIAGLKASLACSLAASLLVSGSVQAALFTMSKECREQVAAGNDMNQRDDAGSALELFTRLAGECKTSDAVEAIQVGLAHAHNDMAQFDQALAAADVALETTDQKSLNALFEKAYATEALGDPAGATALYDQIILLTEKNENVRERATIHAKVADLKYRNGDTAGAEQYLSQAEALDPDNPSFDIQRGDWATADGDYQAAFSAYDAAVAKGRTDADMFGIRSDAALKMVADKYGTANVQELRQQMTADEKSLVCGESEKALELGLRDMQLDMFVALVCQ
jgi:tetratricopeptide (TPR) repeat protein